MRLLNSTSVILLPAIATTQVLATTTPATASASATLLTKVSASSGSSAQLVEFWSPLSTLLPQPTDSSTHHLDLRQAQVATAAIATVPVQVPALTTYQANEVIGGVATQVNVIYTQLFTSPLDQGPLPASGSIGMGTIQGQIGIVNTNDKRDAMPAPTAMPELQMDKREIELERSLEAEVEDKVMKRRSSTSLAKKVDATSAGSALALLVALTAMIVV